MEPPKKTNSTVNIIGIDAIFAFIFLKIWLGFFDIYTIFIKFFKKSHTGQFMACVVTI